MEKLIVISHQSSVFVGRNINALSPKLEEVCGLIYKILCNGVSEKRACGE